MSSHKEQLSAHKLKMLRRAAREVESTGRNEFSIRIFADSITDYNNLQKLRFHGLIAHPKKDGVKVRGGMWLITRQGWEFMEGKIELPKWVEIEKNHIIDRSVETIGVRDVYHGSEAIITTFQYKDAHGWEMIRPMVQQTNLQESLGL